MSKEIAKEEIKRLVKNFENNKSFFMCERGEIGERGIEEQLITPFFKALGWFNNPENSPVTSRDVRLQSPISLKRGIDRGGSGKKKVDYAFRISGVNKFFLEAKVPYRQLRPVNNAKVSKDTIESIWQAKTYGWSLDVPIVILTDFEEFRVCNPISKPIKKRYWEQIIHELELTYDQYEKKFDLIWDTFSKEAVINGSLEKYNKSRKGIKKETIDDALLDTIDRWRKKLADNIAYNLKKENKPQLSSFRLTEAVQTIIDRIIFIRFLEDNGIENTRYLHKYFTKDDPEFIEQKNIYKNIVTDISLLSKDYNGGIFGRDIKDRHFSENLTISDSTLKYILKELYDESPYDFSVIPIDILGAIYERFLGKVIKVVPSGKVEVIEKEEVRKAHGVYYTPKYIVDYIVENTVGELIKDKTPNQISKIRILDPACGSGTFLIGAFDRIISEHKKYYKSFYEKGDFKLKNKDWIATKIKVPTVDEKTGKRIENEETEITLSVQKKKEILLNNIYGVDIDKQAVDVTKMSLYFKVLEDESFERKQLTLHGSGGKMLPNLDDNIKRGNSLIDNDFYKDKDLSQFSAEEMQEKINAFDWDKEFLDIFRGKNPGFDVVIGNPPYLKITVNNIKKAILEYYNLKFKSLSGGSSKNLFQIFIENIITLLKPKIFSFIVPEALLTTSSNKLLRKFMTNEYNLKSLAVFDNFVFENATIGSTIFVLDINKKESSETQILKLNKNNGIQLLKTIQFNSDSETWNTQLKKENEKLFTKLSNNVLLKELSKMSKGMVVKDRKKVLEAKPNKYNLPFLLGSNLKKYFYNYKYYAEYKKLNIIGGTRSIEKQLKTPRLLIRRTGRSLCATLSEKEELIESTIYILTSTKLDLKYLLGLINSKLLSFYLKQKLITNIQGFPQVLMSQLEQLPIKMADPKTVMSLVDQMLKTQELLHSTKVIPEQEIYQKKINLIDSQIDRLVYELYGLTEEEIKIVEGNT